MGACSGITQGAVYSCTDPLKSGVNERLLVGNLDDIDFVTYDPIETSVITAITMKAGKAMYAFQGVRSSVKPQVDLIASDISVGFSHQVDFSVFEVDSAQKVNIQGMSALKQFCIYQNPKDSSLGDAVWEVMGINAGLETAVVTRIANDQATGGAYTIQLKTPATGGSETGLPNSFWDTDISTTEAKINSIVSGANLALVTGTVETASPSDIVLTFDKNITIAGSITVGGTANTVINVAIAGAVVTVTVGTPYIAAEPITLSGDFTAADGVISLSDQVIVNNVI